MKEQTYGFSISFVLHALGVLTIMTMGQFLPAPSPQLVIDFSILPSLEKHAPTAVPQEKPRPKPVKKVVKPKPLKKKVEAPPKKIEPIVKKEIVPIEPEVKPEEVPQEVIEPVPQTAEVVDPEDNLMQPEPDFVTAEEETVSADNVPAEPVLSGAAYQEQARTQYMKAHFEYIKKYIQKKVVYPRIARKMGWEGRVLLSFIVCEDGHVQKIKIVESSGYALLDKNAIQAIEQAAPFPSPPVRAELIIPISYGLV